MKPEPGEACRRLPSPTHRLIGRALSSSGRIELPGYPRAAVAVLKCRASAKGDKMPKLKTKSGVKKRFKLTATGKVKHGVAGKRNRLISHNAKYIRQNRGTEVLSDADVAHVQIGRASGRERVCQDGYISGVAVTFK